MPTLYITYGLPASGKSTWSKNHINEHPNTTYVNKDSIRQELGIRAGDFAREKEVKKIEANLIQTALDTGKDLIIDNTHNAISKYRPKYEYLAKKHGYTFVVVDFTHVPLEECISRDATREKPVGEKIILKMYNEHYAPKINSNSPKILVREIYNPDPSLPKTAIVDLDGTLTYLTDRGPFEYSKCGSDGVHLPVLKTIQALIQHGTLDCLIFLTAREESGRKAATEFLEERCGFYIDGNRHNLLMKANGDFRSDIITKKEMFEKHIRNKYNVLMCFEDRLRVAEMYRSLGLTVFHVAD